MAKVRTPMAFVRRIVYLKAWSASFRHVVALLPDWITPNVVTVFRASLTLPIFLALSTGHYWASLAVFAVAMSLDVVDGAIAHVKNMSTPLGAFLDPLADKMIVCGALIAVWPALPAWILIIAGVTLVYAAGLTLLRIYRMFRDRRLTGPALARTVVAKPAGKVKTMFDVLAAMTIIAGLALGSPAVINAGGILLVIGSCLAGVVYFFRTSD